MPTCFVVNVNLGVVDVHVKDLINYTNIDLSIVICFSTLTDIFELLVMVCALIG